MSQYNSSGIASYISIFWICLALSIMIFLRKYCNHGLFRWHTYISLGFAYFCVFAILLIVPADVALTIVGRTETLNGESNYDEYTDKFYDMYISLFWPAFFLGSLFLGWQEIYNQNGHFSIWTRCKDTTKRLLKFWGMMGVVGIIILIIVVSGGYVEGSSEAITVTCVTLSNTYGLFVIVILLGYGLVELPRQIWRYSDLDKRLLHMQHKAAADFKRLSESSMAISLTVADCIKTNEEVIKMRNKELIKASERVLEDCPKEYRSGSAGKIHRDKNGDITIDTLANLRRQLNLHKSHFRVAQGRVETIKKQVYYLEDVIQSRDRKDGIQRVKWSFCRPESTHRQWLWHTKYKPLCTKILGILCATASFFVILGEIGLMAGESSDISVYALIVHDDERSASSITIFVFITLLYIAYITMWSLFQMRLANLMEILPNQSTTPKSMSFNARQCCRLTYPLIYNYLSLLYESGVEKGNWMRNINSADDGIDDDMAVGIQETAFSRFYGKMDVVPFFGDNFNIFFPIMILILCTFTFFNLFNKFLVWIKLPSLQFGDIAVTEKKLREGRKQLERHRKQLERTAQRKKARRRLNKLRKPSFVSKFVGKGKNLLGMDLNRNNDDDDIDENGNIQKKSGPKEESFVIDFGDEEELNKMIDELGVPEKNDDNINDDDIDLDEMIKQAQQEASQINSSDDEKNNESSSLMNNSGTPSVLGGFLMKKSPNKFVGWQLRYFEIVDGGYLAYWKVKDKIKPDTNSVPAGKIDLKILGSISIYEKKGVEDPTRFNLDLGERIMKLKGEDKEDAEKWIEGIEAWRDHVLMELTMDKL